MPIEMTCESCKQPFYCYVSEAEKGRKYCSVECRGNHLHKKGVNAASRTPVNFTCRECSKAFVMMQSNLKAYQKKFNRDPLYCSMNCSNIGRKKDSDARNRFTCKHCGKLEIRSRNTEKFRIYRQQKYCSQECKSRSQETAAYERFKAGNVGRHVKRNGYIWLAIPALANNGKKTEMLEHRYVMEQHLGRKLYPEETVHHINGKRAENGLENLELFSSRHGPGQRVVDKVAFAIEILTLYPSFATDAGVELRQLTTA